MPTNRQNFPSYRRRWLGKELRRLRENAGKSMHQAGEVLDVKYQSISNLELGLHRIRKTDLAELLKFYGVEEATRAILEDVRKNAETRGWWTTYGPAVPEWFRPYVDMESGAQAVRKVELELIPGLLQTEAYARALNPAARHVTPADAESAVQARLERQKRLLAEPPLELWAVISEAAIHRVVGDPALMADQLTHLLKLTELPNVKLQVIPFDAGAHASMAGTFALIDFSEFPSMVYVEYPAGGLVMEEDDDVTRYTFMFDDLRDVALSTADSRSLIASRLQQLGKDHHDPGAIT